MQPLETKLLMNRLFLMLGALLILALTPVQSLAVQNQNDGDPLPPARPALHPIARSQQERNDFNAAFAITGATASEEAANNFAARYPDSALRQYLYSRAMQNYELENNPAGILAMAQKVLALDPNDCLALVLKATVLANSLEKNDADRTKKIDEIRKTANRAIENVGTGFEPPAGATPAQAAVYKTTLQSMAYSALGIMELKTGDDANAERDLTRAAILKKITPDPYVWYHLALAQDHRKKYAAALNSVQQALQLASSHPQLQRLAEIEFDRLSGLVGQGRRPVGESGAEPPQ
jgi:tetratricopeptide (TPR) repeat protein